MPDGHIYPTFRCRDARAEIAWLVEALGFEEVLVVGEGESVAHAEPRLGEGNLWNFGTYDPLASAE